MHVLEKLVLDFIRAHDLLSGGDRVVAAVSGGADSVCLLHILHNISSELGISLHVAHLDHGLRGDASAADADYVRSLADTLGLPWTIEKRDVRGYRREHCLSLEEAAREVRYRFLAEAAADIGAASVAVAHTRSDHVETVLLHLLRGSGLSGLVGLKEAAVLRYKRVVEPLKVIRPLLCATRTEIDAYCRENRLAYRTDATNESLTPTRNRIRLKLLPALRRDFNPRIDEVLDRLSRLAADDVDFIEAEAGRAVNELVGIRDDVALISKQAFLKLHPALRRAALRQVLSQSIGSPKDIEAVHIEAMMALAAGVAGRSINLPGGLTFASSYEDLMLGRDLSGVVPLPPIEGERRLNIPGVTELTGWRVTASVVETTDEAPIKQEKNTSVELMDFDVAGGEISVRARRPGDRFQPLGMSGEKKLNNFFIDAKVPVSWRPHIPILVNPVQIVWVAGYRLDDRVKVTPLTKRVLRLEFTPTAT
jgi:tRNA(Ile)-lysidine synthase